MFTLRLAKYFRRPFPLTIRSTTIIAPNSVRQTRLDLDQLLERLDGEAHRRGRLNPGLVRGAMQKAAIELDSINPTQALLLIRCSGSLLISELPSQRQRVLDHMIEVFKQKQVLFDVTHYNSYMRISLQNNSFFDPMKILEEIKSKRIVPNLTTFRLLIECYARQGRPDNIQKILNEMKEANLNIESLTLTHLLSSYAQTGNSERVESLFGLFKELDLKPISETYEQFFISYLKEQRFDKAKEYFIGNASKMDNQSLFRLIFKSAESNRKDLFQMVINAVDQNSLADICVQYILCATDLLDAKLDDYAFQLIDSFPKRDETLRFDVMNFTMLNLLKIRLPPQHFRPFSALTVDDIKRSPEVSTDLQCERETVSSEQLDHFRKTVLQRIDHFTDDKDRWLVIHQILYHAYQNYIPLSYIYAIYDVMHKHKYEYRSHYMRPVLVKFRRIYMNKSDEMIEQTRQFLDYLQKQFSVNYDPETLNHLIEFLFDRCYLDAAEIDNLFKKVNLRLVDYWQNLYLLTFKRINRDLLNSLKIFLNMNKTVRFEYTPTIRDETCQGIQWMINQLRVEDQNGNEEEILGIIRDFVEFLEILNRRFVKNQEEILKLNDETLLNIFQWSLERDESKSLEMLKNVLNLFERKDKMIPLTNVLKEKIYHTLGLKSNDQTSHELITSLNQKSREESSSTISTRAQTSPFLFDESSHIYTKSIPSPKTMTFRELEDHLIELKRKKMNISGTISKLLIRYCTECLDGERTLSLPVRETYMKRIAELESIYFDKKQTSGFPSLGVIAMLIDYYSRIQLNLDKVIFYINLSNQSDPSFRLDPHKCVSVIRLLIKKDSYPKAIELIDSLGVFNTVPNYMYRRVRDLLIDGYLYLNFEQFETLVDKLLTNRYIDPSVIILTFIVRKSFQDQGPLQAFETAKKILLQWNNLVGFFPIIRKLLRDDCSEELKQILIKIGKIRTRTYAYEQLAFALIHERRNREAVRVCQHISRATFEEHCQRYVRELFYFPTDTLQSEDEGTNLSSSSNQLTISMKNDPFETNHVFDSDTISLINFLDFIEQYPVNARHLSIDTFFYYLFKAFEKVNRVEEFTKIMRDHSPKYVKHFSSKTKEAFNQAGILLPIKSLSSPKQKSKRVLKQDRFLPDYHYEEEQKGSP